MNGCIEYIYHGEEAKCHHRVSLRRFLSFVISISCDTHLKFESIGRRAVVLSNCKDMDGRVEDGGFFWVEETQGPLSVPMTKKRKVRPKKMEFVDWGSKLLIEFLQSIGKDTTKQLSRYDVTSIINEYVKLNKLLHPEKKKRILCDERLHFLFGKKSLIRIKIYDLLEAHFAENQDESEDEFLYSSEEKEENYCKELKASTSDRKALHPKKKVPETPKSCFAAIVAENIKLVYLKRSLVQELLKYPETFESKIVGSFVRMKSDPNDYSQKNSHQLLQIKGVRNASGVGDTGAEVLLEASNMLKDIRISMLSDDDLTEEECKDLSERVKAGFLERPLGVEFEQKAHMLHEDITKHWLVREVALLQNLIDRANEKGWRRELFEYMERKQLLQTPAEQSRLLHEVPKVIAEALEPEATPQEFSESEKQQNNGLPHSLPNGSSENDAYDLEANRATQNSGSKAAAEIQPVDFVLEQKTSSPVNFVLEQKTSSLVIRNETIIETSIENAGERSSLPEMPVKKVIETQVIDLSDDDDDEVEAQEGQNGHVIDHHHTESSIWYYLDPQGHIQGPFAMTLLKRWSDADYFHPDFKVWKAGQTPDEAVLLREALHRVFSK